jgi:phage tail sheath protein FI
VEVFGIESLDTPVDYQLGDATSLANILNEGKVTTFIRHGGFRVWGNLTGSIDQKWQFISVRRTADIINDSILANHLWAVDRNITRTYLTDVADGVNAYLSTLVNLGAVIGGRCWPDPDLNSPDQIAQGKVYFNFEFTPPYPAQTVTFRSILTNDYLSELID